MGVRRHPCSNLLSLYSPVLPAAKHKGRLKDLLSGKVLHDMELQPGTVRAPVTDSWCPRCREAWDRAECFSGA